MKALTLEEIRQATYGRWLAQGRPAGRPSGHPGTATVRAVAGGTPAVPGGDPVASPASVEAIATDTRKVKAGELFFAIPGERFDGHEFLSQAAEAGCVAAVVRLDKPPSAEVAGRFAGGIIAVRDTVRALGQLAEYHRSLVPARVVAVTGSNGKTTVKRMIHHILSKRLAGTCSPKSFNNSIGLPLTLLGVGASDDYVVCEIGTNAPGEVAALAAIARPDVAVITSVGEAHLERFGSLERVAGEKASIVGSLADDGLVVAWADSRILDHAVAGYKRRTIRFGADEASDLRLTAYEPRGQSQRFQLNGRVWAELPLPGRHNALNALAAIAVAQRFGWLQDDAAAALADFQGVEMRLQWLACGPLTVLNDAYNANPTSMLAAAAVLAETAGDRKVLVAGDMREMGEQAEMLHRRTGRQIAELGVDLLIGIGALGRYIAEGAGEGGCKTAAYDSVEQACSQLAGLLQPRDVVLIKGSRAMEMERLIAPIQEAFAAPKAGRADDGPAAKAKRAPSSPRARGRRT